MSRGVFYFESNSANGQPLGDVNKTLHMEVLFNSLQEKGAKIDNLDKFTQVINQGSDSDLKNSALKYGTKVALALFNALPTDKKNNALMGKAQSFYNAMDKLSQHPDSTANKKSAYQELKTFTSDIIKKMHLSEKTGQADNLETFCSNYLENSVYPDIINKLAGKLSPEYVEELRNNPAKVVEHLYANQNKANDSIINELKKEFFEHKGTGDKTVKMFSLIEALEQKTQIIAGLITNSADQEASPAAGLAAGDDIGQPRPADGNNAANPGPVAPNVTNITNNYNITYYESAPTSNHVSTTSINLSDTAATTKPEDNKSRGTAANQTPADMAHFSAQTFDDVDSMPAPPATDNLKPAASADTSSINKSLNSSGTLFGTKGPASSWLNKGSKVTLTNDGQVRDLSRKQADGQGDAQQKQPTSLNTFGNQFVGFGQQNPGPTPLRSTDKAEQDAPQVNNTQSSSTVKDIPVSDNVLNSDNTPQDAAGIYHAVPVNTETDKPLNSAGTLVDTKEPEPSSWDKSGSEVILTRGGQVRDLNRKQTYGQGGAQQGQPTSVNAQGTLFAGMGKSGAAPTPSRSTGETQQVRQDAPQVSYKADLLIPGKKPNFISTLDIQVNSDGTLQQTDDIYHATPAQVVAEKQLNAQGTSFGMKVGAASASAPSGLANNGSAVTLTNDGRVRDLSQKETYARDGSQQKETDVQQKSSSSVNAQGNQFVGFGKSTSAPTQSFSASNDAQVTLTQQGAQTRELSSKLAYKLGGAQPKSSSSVNAQGNQFVGFGKNSTAPTQSWINNKGADVVLTQEGAQTRSITEKDQYRTDKLTNSQQPTNLPEAK